MKTKNIDALREARLWIGLLIIPAVNLFGVVKANKEFKSMKNRCEDIQALVRGKSEREGYVPFNYTKKQYAYIDEMVRKYRRQELTEAQWEYFVSEWLV